MPSLPSRGTTSILSAAEELNTTCSWRIAGLAFAAFLPMAWQQLSGYNVIPFYGQSILAKAGVKAYNELGTSVMAVQLLGIGVAAALIERIGRRPLLLFSSGGMAVGAAALGLLLRLPAPPSTPVVAVLYGYVVCFAVGLGPVPWLLLPELGLPRRVRARLASLATATNWGCSFAVTGPPLEKLESRFGLSGQFLFFSGSCLVGFLLMALVVPETGRHRRKGLERRFTFGVRSPRRVPRQPSQGMPPLRPLCAETDGHENRFGTAFQSATA